MPICLAVHICPKVHKIRELNHRTIFLERNNAENGCKNLLASVLCFIEMLLPHLDSLNEWPPNSSPAN